MTERLTTVFHNHLQATFLAEINNYFQGLPEDARRFYEVSHVKDPNKFNNLAEGKKLYYQLQTKYNAYFSNVAAMNVPYPSVAQTDRMQYFPLSTVDRRRFKRISIRDMHNCYVGKECIAVGRKAY